MVFLTTALSRSNSGFPGQFGVSVGGQFPQRLWLSQGLSVLISHSHRPRVASSPSFPTGHRINRGGTKSGAQHRARRELALECRFPSFYPEALPQPGASSGSAPQRDTVLPVLFTSGGTKNTTCRSSLPPPVSLGFTRVLLEFLVSPLREDANPSFFSPLAFTTAQSLINVELPFFNL